jgi:outer membrane receptor for ferrienterochelin and colicin
MIFRKFIICTILYLLSISYSAFSQNKYTISGYITDSLSNERLIGANIWIEALQVGTISNNYGFFSLSTKENNCEISFSYVGYSTKYLNINLRKDTTLNISLVQSNTIGEVTIVSKKNNIVSTEISCHSINPQSLKTMPVFMGEADILRAIQLLPGVSKGEEGMSGINVRGGSSDQNLILLDGVQVYNVNHLFGLFSVFNTDAVKSIDFYKGGFSAKYGGRVSSVLDIRLKEGNLNQYHGSFSLGLISANLLLEGPIVKSKSSFLVSYRRTFFDLLAYPIEAVIYQNNGWLGYLFQDFNLKLNSSIGKKSHLYFSLYQGNDKYFMKFDEKSSSDGYDYENKSKDGFGWGNITNALRWNYNPTKKIFINNTLTFSNYKFNFEKYYFYSQSKDSILEKQEYSNVNNSGITDYSLFSDLDFYINNNLNLKAGLNATSHNFKPNVSGVFSLNFEDLATIDTFSTNTEIKSSEYSAYIESEIILLKKINIIPGFRINYYQIRDTFYLSPEPRINISFQLTPSISIKSAYSKTNQNIHLLTNSSVGLPTDMWLPVTDKVKPIESNQYIAGLFLNHKNKFETSVEFFYKTFKNVIEYKDGANKLNDWENNIEHGTGQSYGFEFVFSKTFGKVNSWLSYTLSKSERTFENINQGKTFLYKYDRRHCLNLSLSYFLNKNIDINLMWTYATGHRYTLATIGYRQADFVFNFFLSDPQMVEGNFYTQKNEFKMPDYHRLDANINFSKQKNKYKRIWSLGLYNVYSRLNPIYMQIEADNKLHGFGIQFPIPFISYIIKF